MATARAKVSTSGLSWSKSASQRSLDELGADEVVAAGVVGDGLELPGLLVGPGCHQDGVAFTERIEELVAGRGDTTSFDGVDSEAVRRSDVVRVLGPFG